MVTRREKSMDESEILFEHVAKRCSCGNRIGASAGHISRETGNSEFLDSSTNIAETK
jgi:hypothetical protein